MLWLPLAVFWLLFGSLWAPLADFGSVLATLGLFLEPLRGLGGARSRQGLAPPPSPTFRVTILGAILGPKPEKRHPKIDAKIGAEKVPKHDAKMTDKLCQNEPTINTEIEFSVKGDFLKSMLFP